MDKSSILETLDSLSSEHEVIAEEINRVKISIAKNTESTRNDVLRLSRALKIHFFREDMELYPIVMKVFCPSKERKSCVSMFETEEEKIAREQNCLSDEQKRTLWASDYDDRDARSELISFAKITLQLFEIIGEYLQGKSGDRNTLDAKILGVIQILEARVEYEEMELFPKIRQMTRFCV
ncbi:MAG: hemerythrin domain-containing protein [Magnetococcus sp. YQC-3]